MVLIVVVLWAVLATSPNGLKIHPVKFAKKLHASTSSDHKDLSAQAMREEGMDVTDEEPYLSPKYPRSWLNEADKLNHTKVYRINFQGKLAGGIVTRNETEERAFVPEFAKQFFGENDYYLATRVPGWTDEDPSGKRNTNYVALGVFDHSLDEAPPPKTIEISPGLALDERYMETLAQSNFSLCPAGDKPFTVRFFEAAAVGTICILKDPSHAGGMEEPEDTQKIPWRFYLLNDIMKDPSSLIYRDDWVQENRENFEKYHTYLKGDNYPPNCRCQRSHWSPTHKSKAEHLIKVEERKKRIATKH